MATGSRLLLFKLDLAALFIEKTKEKHGYDSVQLGFEEIEEKKLSKPQVMGHFKKHNSPPYRYLKEFRLKLYKDIEEGEVFDVSMFTENEVLESYRNFQR